jgi:hypothetical protein
MMVMAAAVGTLVVTLAVLARHLEPYIRAQLVAGLEERFHTRVELAYFHVAVHEGQEARWGLWATGRGLRIWPPRKAGESHAVETAVESVPLIQLDEFSFHVPLRYRDTHTLKIPQIRLVGLTIDVPPKPERDKETGIERATERPAGADAANDGGTAGAPGIVQYVTVERVVCERAEVVLETDRPDKLPLEFAIKEIKLTHLAAGKPMEFEAVLTNAKPQGLIRTKGSFGPWVMSDPGESPVKGKYQFDHANLADFNGIAGMLDSTGTYDGTLREIGVAGEADVPDFRLTRFGTAMELHTDFKARVDGTNGDTYLDQVDARLGQAKFRLQGKIVRVRTDGNGMEIPLKAMEVKAKLHKPAAGKPGTVDQGQGTRDQGQGTRDQGQGTREKGQGLEGQESAGAGKGNSPGTPDQDLQVGHVIDMKVNVPGAPLESFLKLVSKSGTALMTGTVETQAVLQIPPGKEPVPDRIKLDGQFNLQDARFPNQKLQEKIEGLSLRAQGRQSARKDTNPDSITAQMQGSFHLAHGVIGLPDLKYTVPGAQIDLKGTYALNGALHFDGIARMQATVSQIVGGWKGFLLKPADRFFKKDGAGTLVPIKVRGTRQDPQFGMDFARLGNTHPETTGSRE